MAFAINTQQDILKGHRLYTQALAHSPRDTQYWQNLIQLLVAVGDIDEAQDKLESFKTANTHSGNEIIYQMLQDSIDDKRIQQSTTTSLEHQADN